jgi:hypothetical protein
MIGGATIQIRMCYSCNGQHDDLEVKQYHRENPPFTHWYECPITHDPVPLTLVVCNNIQHELHGRVMRDVFERQGQPAMFATFFINKEGGVTVNTHTNEWPAAKLDETLAAIHKDITRRKPPPPAPLPMVPADKLAMFRGLQSVTQVIAPVMPAEAATAEPADADGDQDIESDEQH